MTTEWTVPANIIQYVEPGGESVHIPWDDSRGFDVLKSADIRGVRSLGQLSHIARSPKHDILNKTYYIRATGFDFYNLPEVLSGIELLLLVNRYGRVTDDTVELVLGGESVGENQASLSIAPEKIYGGPTNLWNVKNLSVNDLRDSSFGIVIRFSSHPHWPHKDPVIIGGVRMRIH
jgi:hypothetical protein